MPPALRAEPGPCLPGPKPGAWLAAWRIHNDGPGPIAITEAWLPHDGFFAPRYCPDPPLTIPPGASIALERPITCPSPPNTEVPNAFLILRVTDEDATAWRVFFRLLINVDEAGTPHQQVEAVTAQQVAVS